MYVTLGPNLSSVTFCDQNLTGKLLFNSPFKTADPTAAVLSTHIKSRNYFLTNWLFGSSGSVQGLRFNGRTAGEFQVWLLDFASCPPGYLKAHINLFACHLNFWAVVAGKSRACN